jgi:hypothetical protein
MKHHMGHIGTPLISPLETILEFEGLEHSRFSRLWMLIYCLGRISSEAAQVSSYFQ